MNIIVSSAISLCIICKLASGTTTILKFENDDLVLPCRGYKNDNHQQQQVFWIGPHSHVIRRDSRGTNGSLLSGGDVDEKDPTISHPTGNKYYMNENGSLVVEKLQTVDAGKFLCMSAAAPSGGPQFQQTPEILDEYYLPYVIVRKDHMKSFYTAIAIAGGFFLTAMAVYLTSEFKKGGKIRDSASNVNHHPDDHVTPYQSSVIKNDIMEPGYRGGSAQKKTSYENRAYKSEPNDYDKYLGNTNASHETTINASHETKNQASHETAPASREPNGNGYHQYYPNNAEKGPFINTIQITDTPM